MKKNYLYEIVILILAVIFNIILDIQNPEIIKSIAKEDGIVEMGTAIFYLLAGFVLFYSFYKSKTEITLYFLSTRRNYFILLLGLLFIFFAGEEISWGQRIFDLNTPEAFRNNLQDEINIHNLPFFHAVDKDEIWKHGINRLLTGAGIFAMFCFLYCLLIPLFNRYNKLAHAIINKIHLPVIPIWIGFLFLFNHFICESIESFGLIASIPIVEIKELNYSVLFFMASISLFNMHKNR